jgi:hypothetical protein
MQTTINLITLIIGAFMTATFSHFLHWCIGSPNGYDVKTGRIFSKYGVWISKQYDLTEERLKGKGLNWYKAMGMCVYCMGVYIAIISLFIGYAIGWFNLTATSQFGRYLEVLSIFILYPSISNYFLRKIK